MQSTFSGIEIGKRSLIAHTQGMTTVGHNLSNASTEGYSRQRVHFQPTDPLYMPQLNRENTPGQIGQGVDVTRIERVHDELLEGKIVSRANGRGYWESRDSYMLQLEQVYNEPTESSVRTLMNQFWDSWQELSIHPQERAARQAVVQRGEALMDGIHNQYSRMKELRNMAEDDLTATVGRINGILNDVRSLNEEIVKVEALGDNPNDLLDRRDLLVKELSGLINITVDNRDADEFTIHTQGLHLMQGRVLHPLRTEPDPLNEGYSSVRWAETGEEAYFTGGKIKALLDMRDIDIRGEIQKLDVMAMNYIDLVNEVHRAAYGLNGENGQAFFEEIPFVTDVAGNYDRNGDGDFDSSYIFRVSGTNVLNGQDHIGLQGTITLSGPSGNLEIPYNPTDTVGDVVNRINLSGAEIVARLNQDGHMVLKALPASQRENPDFVMRHIEDSGQFLSGYAGILQQSGPEGAYDWEQVDAVLAFRGGGDSWAVAPIAHPSGWIEISSGLKNDVNRLAAGFGENGRPANPGDGSAALAIAQLRTKPVMLGNLMSFDDFFAETIADVGLRGERAEQTFETESLVMKELEGMKDSLSGVNLDEEFSQLIKFQHGYNAAARFISTFNTMLDTIINRLGV
jgi:flagellar hook-associated protein 1